MRNGAIVQAIPSIAANTESGTRPMLDSRRDSRSNPRNRARKGHGVRATKDPFPAREVSIPGYVARQTIPESSPQLLEATTHICVTSELERQVVQLRAENAELRSKNDVLQQHVHLFNAFGRPPQTFDDPFEPPPEMRPLIPTATHLWVRTPSSAGSTSAPASEFLSLDLQITDDAIPFEEGKNIQDKSLELSIASSPGSTKAKIDKPVVPQRWAKQIPKGIVQQARAMFE